MFQLPVCGSFCRCRRASRVTHSALFRASILFGFRPLPSETFKKATSFVSFVMNHGGRIPFRMTKARRKTSNRRGQAKACVHCPFFESSTGTELSNKYAKPVHSIFARYCRNQFLFTKKMAVKPHRRSAGVEPWRTDFLFSIFSAPVCTDSYPSQGSQVAIMASISDADVLPSQHVRLQLLGRGSFGSAYLYRRAQVHHGLS